MLNDYLEQCAKYDEGFENSDDWDERRKYEYLITSGLAGKGRDGHIFLTRAGVLLFCRRERIPRDTFHVHVKFVRESTEDSLTEESYGSVYFLYKKLYERLSPLFERRIGLPGTRDNSGGESVVYEYPKTAIVEALVNFLIHRDYSLDDNGFITIYPDRVEFINPGQSEIPPKELMAATSPLRPLYRRNQRLIEAMNKARLNQREGRGIVRIKEALENNGSYLSDGSLALSLTNDEIKNRFILVIYKRKVSFISGSQQANTDALHQLPPPPRDFTGRVRELDELMSRIERGGVTISGLQGLGGIGKTALALKLAERLAPRYPDAQFYLDLKGADRQPLSVADALAHVVRAYHPTAKLPEGEAELQSLYLSVLHGRRALLLMDNAAGREQVEPLVPPEGCVLLVTSRQHFHVPGLFALDLETLSPEDARQLLLKIAPRIGESADEIARLCGYLPLALRLAAGALAERANLSAADYVRRLSDAKKRLELVEASLTLSYELLGPEQQRLWRVLAVFPDTFNAAAVATVWELDADAAQDALGDLVRYSLLEWDADTRRFRQHDLARLFADSRMSEGEGRATWMRHAEHYLTVLGECDEFYLKGGDAIKSGLTLFDVERRNIEAGQEWACRHSSEDEAAAWLCNKYPAAGAYVLSLRKHPREFISWLEAALAAARQLKDRASEGRHSGNLGNAYAYLGDTRRAVEFYEQYLAIAREIGDRRHEGIALGNLGSAYEDLGETRRAVEFHEQALVVSHEIGDQRSEGTTLGNLGSAYAYLGDTRRAIEFYEQALVDLREIGDRRSEGDVLGNLGVAYKNLGETRRAVEFYEQQLTIVREIGDRSGEGNALFNTGLALDALGDRAKAIAHVEAALEIYEQIESPTVEKARAKLAQWRGEA